MTLMAHARCMLAKQGYKRARTCTRQFTRAPTHTHASMCARAHTHSEYAILIAFPRQKWFREYEPMLSYTYTARLLARF